MNLKNTLLTLATFTLFLFSACTSEAQNQNEAATMASTSKIQVIQFHSEHRCMTCNKIEVLTKETLKSFENISFTLINVDDAKNEKIAEKFEATGTALFLYNPKTGKKKDLTDFAFMNASSKDKFIAGLKKEITAFQKL